MSTTFNFSYNPSEASTGFDLIATGDYEAFISAAEIKTFGSGNTGIAMTITIRDDIPGQEYGKRKLWQNLVPTDKGMAMFHTIAKAVGKEAGWQVPSLEAYRDEIQSKPIRIFVNSKWETNQQTGEKSQRNNIAAFKESQAGGAFTAPTGMVDPFAQGKPINISDDDLPF